MWSHSAGQIITQTLNKALRNNTERQLQCAALLQLIFEQTAAITAEKQLMAKLERFNLEITVERKTNE